MSEIDGIRKRILELEQEVVGTRDRLAAISEELWRLRMALPDPESESKSKSGETKPAPDAASPPKVPPAAAKIPEPSVAVQAARSTTAPSPPPPRPSRQSPGFHSRVRAFIAERIGDVPLEDFIGTNLLLKAGVFILVAGVTYFMKVAYDDFFGPWLKLATLTAVSIAALIGGHMLHRRRNLRLFGLWIVAGGSMLLYYCVYAAHGVEATRVIPRDKSFLAYVLLLPTAGFLIWNSLRYNSEAMTGGIYFLAFFAISLNETGGLNYTFAMTALVFLAGGLIIILFLRRWKYLTGLGLIATYGNFLLYSRSLPRDSGGFVLRASDADPADYFLRGIAYLAIYWIIFTVSAFTMRDETTREKRIAASVHIANAFTFLALVFYIRPEPTNWGSFIVTTVMGVLYIACAVLGRYLKKDFIWKSSLLIGIGLLVLAPALKFSDYGLTFAWLVQSSVLITLGFALNEKYMRNTGYLAMLLKLGSFFVLPAGKALHPAEGPDASLWFFDLNRGLLYVFMLTAFLGLRYTAMRYAELLTKPDRIARRAFAILTALTAVMLAYHVLLAPHQAFLLIPFALLMLGLHAFSARAGSETYALENLLLVPALTVIALITALPLLVTAPDPAHVTRSFLTLLFVALGAGAAFAYEIRFAMPFHGASRVRAEILLWTAAIALTGLAMHYGRLESINTLTILFAAGMLVLYRSFGFGLTQASGLLLHAFCTGTYFYFSSRGDASRGGIFLWNAGVLAAFLILFLTAARSRLLRRRAKPRLRAARIITAVFLCLLVPQILDHLLDAPYLQAGFAAFALAAAGMGFFRRDTVFLSAAAAYQVIALLAGPVAWVLSTPDFENTAYRLSLSVIGPSLALTALAFIALPGRGVHVGRLLRFLTNTTYCTAFAGWFAYVFLLLPEIYRPSGFALLTAANYYLLRRFGLRDLFRVAPIAFVVTVISFAYLLYAYAGPDTSVHALLKSLTGLLPLGLLALSLVLHGALQPREKLTKFQSAGAGALLLGFILLTMTIIQSSYWTLAWVVEAFALIVAGLRWNFRVLRYGGMALIIVALGKLALWDVRNLDETARIAVLIGVGLLFVAASYLYARFRTRLFPETEEKKEQDES